jgi:hypothetical protein
MVVLLAVLGGAMPSAWAGTTATGTTLTVTSGGSAVTSVPWGTVVTLTATVTAGTTPVTTGQVKFCDATATYCEDIHILGTAQLTSAGAAVFKFRPGWGSHSYKAVFLGNAADAGSSSGASPLTVSTPAPHPSATAIAQSGSAGNYTLTATVGGAAGSKAPTGTVSFLDTSNANEVVGTAALVAGAPGLGWVNVSSPGTGFGVGADSVAVADFNGDGILDLAIVNQLRTVTILLGNGDGTFTATAESPSNVSQDSGFIVTADFNGDGIPDLAFTNPGRSTVTVLLGNGDGTFRETAESPSTGDEPMGMVVGDFNGDGIPDLAVVNDYDSTVTILLGNGDGTFKATPASPATGIYPYEIAVGDFNGDGIPDLAVTNECGSDPSCKSSGTVTVLLGKGDGTFTAAASPSSVGQDPTGIAAADFNGDGIPDLAVTNSDSNWVTVLLGEGNGTFHPQSTAATGSDPVSIAFGDFNGDGIPDLAVTNLTSSTVTVLLGKGDGTFTATAASPSTGNNPLSIAVGDFNGDGIPDLVTANVVSDTATVLLTEPATASATATGISINGAGTHLVEAAYPGDSNYGASTSVPTGLTANQPTLTSPTPGTVLGSSATFSWSPGVGVTEYAFFLGTNGAGSYNLYDSGHTTATSATVTGLPENGVTLYARLWWYVNGAWQYSDYTFTEIGTPVKAALTSPPLGIPLGSSATFSWTSGTGVTMYALYLGTNGGGSSNLYNSGHTTATSATVSGLPTNGGAIYVRLWSEIDGGWQFTDYVYTESGTPVKAVLTTPAPGSVLSGSPITFSWTSGTGVTLYDLFLGTTGAGSYNLYNSGHTTVTSVSVSGLPANGVTVYARLWSEIDGVWQFTDYTYTEQ